MEPFPIGYNPAPIIGERLSINMRKSHSSFPVPRFSKIMLTPARSLPSRFFYPIGNTPAVSLVAHQPPENKTAEILLLGCGDIRNVLYTVFCNQQGAYDEFH